MLSFCFMGLKCLLITCSVCYAPVQAELTFSAGDIIHVFGDMDEDGFFYVSLKMTRRSDMTAIYVALKTFNFTLLKT